MVPDEKTAAICGLFCGICPFYPEQCHGCLSDKLTAHCVTCPNGFRDCAAEHGVIRCYECEGFPCGRLQEFSRHHIENGICHHAEVIPDLQRMKRDGVATWVEEKTREYTCPRCGELIYWMEKNSHQCADRLGGQG